jgi:hypothetical protein
VRVLVLRLMKKSQAHTTGQDSRPDAESPDWSRADPNRRGAQA